MLAKNIHLQHLILVLRRSKSLFQPPSRFKHESTAVREEEKDEEERRDEEEGGKRMSQKRQRRGDYTRGRDAQT